MSRVREGYLVNQEVQEGDLEVLVHDVFYLLWAPLYFLSRQRLVDGGRLKARADPLRGKWVAARHEVD